MKEVCSCGAEFEITNVDSWSIEAIREAQENWRKNHRHEFAPADPASFGSPLIHESGSSHERQLNEWGTSDRAAIGFTRNA